MSIATTCKQGSAGQSEGHEQLGTGALQQPVCVGGAQGSASPRTSPEASLALLRRRRLDLRQQVAQLTLQSFPAQLARCCH